MSGQKLLRRARIAAWCLLAMAAVVAVSDAVTGWYLLEGLTLAVAAMAVILIICTTRQIRAGNDGSG